MKKVILFLSIVLLSGCASTQTCAPDMSLKPIDRDHAAWQCRQEKIKKDFEQARYVFLGSAFSDMATTVYAVEKYGATEAHPFLQGFNKPYIPMAISDLIVVGVAEYAHKKGFTKDATWLYRFGAVVRLGTTSWNIYQINKN